MTYDGFPNDLLFKGGLNIYSSEYNQQEYNRRQQNAQESSARLEEALNQQNNASNKWKQENEEPGDFIDVEFKEVTEPVALLENKTCS